MVDLQPEALPVGDLGVVKPLHQGFFPAWIIKVHQYRGDKVDLPPLAGVHRHFVDMGFGLPPAQLQSAQGLL